MSVVNDIFICNDRNVQRYDITVQLIFKKSVVTFIIRRVVIKKITHNNDIKIYPALKGWYLMRLFHFTNVCQRYLLFQYVLKISVTSRLDHGNHVGDVIVTDNDVTCLEVQSLLGSRRTHHSFVFPWVELDHHVRYLALGHPCVT